MDIRRYRAATVYSAPLGCSPTRTPGDRALMSSLVAMVQVSLRRSRAAWPIVASAGLICLLAASLLAAGPMYAGAVAIAGLQRVMTDAPVAEANIEVSMRLDPDAAECRRPRRHARAGARARRRRRDDPAVGTLGLLRKASLPGDWSSDGARGARVRRGHRGPCHARRRVLAGPRLGGGGGGRHSRHPRRDLREHRRAARAGGRLPGSPAEPDRPGHSPRPWLSPRSSGSTIPPIRSGGTTPRCSMARSRASASRPTGPSSRRASGSGHARRLRPRERSSPGARCRASNR